MADRPALLTPFPSINLDAIGPDGMAQPATVLAMAAELRAAREVIAQVRLQSRPHAYLRRALEMYDEAVGKRSASGDAMNQQRHLARPGSAT